jgi:lysozyme
MTRTVNADSLALIKQWEGVRLTAYPDPGSKDGMPWTIGYGHTGPGIHKGLRITQDQAEAYLAQDLAKVAAAIEPLIKVSLSDNQFGALVSFTFNVGVSAFAKSTLLKKLNKGSYAAVPAELARWNKNDGKIMPGLVNRRAAEAGLWAKGGFVASSTVEAKPQPVGKWLTPESIGTAGTALAGAGAVASGSGPVQWALGIVLVLAFAAAAGFFIWKKVHPQ